METEDSQACKCGKVCKTEGGLKIHQIRMKCMRVQSQNLCKGQPSKMVEELNLKKTHIAQNLKGDDDVFESTQEVSQRQDLDMSETRNQQPPRI